MFFKHIYDESLAQGSYFVGCQVTGESIVIDAKRDIDTYLEIAEKENLKITHIAETHIHADYLAGSQELAAVTGADLYLSDEGGEDWQYEFPHIGLKDGQVIKVGNLTLEVMHTPGHTPESISLLLRDHPAAEEPVMVFTGDFVFVGDVGRPDLLEKAAGIKGTSAEGASQMYDSVKKFSDLPDYVQIWPAHGAGSACGKSLGAVHNSTVGYEKIRNWAFRYDDRQEFVDVLLEDQPEPPKYFAKMKQLNKQKRPLLVEVPKHPKLTKEQFLSAYHKGMTVIDARTRDVFMKGFLPNSLNIEGGKSFSTWMGWVLNYEEQFMLIADDDQIEDLTRKLMRIGMDNIYGYFADLESLDIELNTVDAIDYDELKTYVGSEDVQIIDVRGKTEYQENHIPGADNIFVGTIADNLNKVEKDKQLVVHCQTGTRTTVAYSLLRKNGFEKIKFYRGGIVDWEAHEAKNKQKEMV
ncbi:MAG TPA: MBL fold metallo-hydrolase [Flavobacteriaceae bacterium]|nr:MBL fold metallo-hydrolase [Flavobacteriaceae bacterium]